MASTFLDKVRSMASLAVATGTKDAPVDTLVLTPTTSTYATTLTNASMGQATTITIPDPGAATANVALAPAANSSVLTATVTMTPANMTVYTTPLQIVPAPGTGMCIMVTSAYVSTKKVTSAFATGTAPIIQYGSTVHGGGTIATASGLVAGDITATTDQTRNLFALATGTQTGLSNLGIYFSCATGDYTAGVGSSVSITVNYVVVTSDN